MACVVVLEDEIRTLNALRSVAIKPGHKVRAFCATHYCLRYKNAQTLTDFVLFQLDLTLSGEAVTQPEPATHAKNLQLPLYSTNSE